MNKVALRKWHRRIALALGAFILLQALSGVVLLVASAPRLTEPPSGNTLSLDRAYAVFVSAMPSAPDRMTLPSEGNATFEARSVSPGKTPWLTIINAHTGRILHNAPLSHYPLELMSELHVSWFFGDKGTLLTGMNGVALLLLVVSGWALWWRSGTVGARGAVWTPLFWLRTHRTLGAVTAIILLFPATTGLLIAWRGPVQTWLADDVPIAAPAANRGPTVSLTALLTTASHAVPTMTPVQIRFGKSAALVILKSDRDTVTGRVWLNPHSGLILRRQDASNAPPSVAIYDFLLRLHEGLLGGWAGRLAVIAIGSLVVFQSLSGGLLFALRRNSARKRKNSLSSPRN